jgi:superfamily I DNA/RNA helicase
MRKIYLTTWFQNALAELDNAAKGRVFNRVNNLLTDVHVAGANFEKFDQAVDDNIYSIRVDLKYRLIIHLEGDAYTFLHIDKHDPAYDWLKHRRVGRHPITHEFQLWTTPNTPLDRKPVPVWQRGLSPQSQSLAVAPIRTSEPPFVNVPNELLLTYGVPSEWTDTVRSIPSIDDIDRVISDHLPAEVTDRLVAHALGEPVTIVSPETETERFGSSQIIPITDVIELEEVLSHPLDLWIAFLHPDQRRLANMSASGPVKVTGSAGTGKTTLALHRACFLALAGKRVLVTTYTRSLASNLERQLNKLCPEVMAQKRIIVQTVFRAASRVLSAAGEPAFRTISETDLREKLPTVTGDFSRAWLVNEWRHVIDAMNIKTLDAYLVVDRSGRGSPLTEVQRREVWALIEPFLNECASSRRWSWSDVAFHARKLVEQQNRSAVLARAFVGGGVDAVVVDEMQDLGPSELAFIRALAGSDRDALFLTGDAGQRIYGRRFSLRSCGINVVGRSSILRVNYRTTGEIRRFADTITNFQCDDMDAGLERRVGIRSVMSGPLPVTFQASTRQGEIDNLLGVVSSWLTEPHITDPGTLPKLAYHQSDIAIFARTNELASTIRQELRDRGIDADDLDLEADQVAGNGNVTVSTLHKAKGLEFKAVAVVATDLIPPVDQDTDPEELPFRNNQERDLLYVGTTRARDALMVSWTGDPSPFLLEALTSTGVIRVVSQDG